MNDLKVKVTKSSKNDNSFRTPLSHLDGMPLLPEKGKNLFLTSSTHESGGIVTSEVKDFTVEDNVYKINTEFSTYIVEIVSEDK